MSSRETENLHLQLLNKILAEKGLVCERPEAEQVEESLTEESDEELGPGSPEEESIDEQVAGDEQTVEHTEEVLEAEPEIFPTPSLRKLLTDKERKIEEQNRIYVLPVEFKTDIDPQNIPRIATTPQQKYIEVLAEMVGCTMYSTSLAEFWFLDTMANLLRRAQEDGLDRQTQAILIQWFCEWIKEMQQFDAASRERMMKRFQDNMLEAAKYLTSEGKLPTPAQAGVYYMARDTDEIQKSAKGTAPSKMAQAIVAEPAPKTVNFEEDNGLQCSLIDLTKIIHYIFDLTDYQYDLVRSVFCHTPDYILIDMPYQLRNPKRIYTVLKPAKPKKEPKPAKDVKGPKSKTKKEEVFTAEYLALLELIARDHKEQEVQEEIERELWNRKSHILPLQFAATDELFDKYWPPPPPPPEPEKLPEPTKQKGKKK